jgi:UDP-3-O-[3-hydroxymyristoyl] N-acetylglucosamine deacetylase
VEAPVAELVVTSTNRATTVEAHGGALRVGTVEHLFAALAGLHVHRDLVIDLDGPELPLLDGGAAQWADAVVSLGIAPHPSPSRILRPATIEAGASRYELSPGPSTLIEVCLELDDARLLSKARWEGDAGDFRKRVAPARTFAFARDVSELVRLELARHVEPNSVVVVTPEAIHWAGAPFRPDEPVRHKLLDLMGDLYLHGGPPLGRVRAFRPGHTGNAQAFREAREAGLFAAR